MHGMRHEVEPRGVGAIPADQRDLEAEAEVEGAGFVRELVAFTEQVDDDDEPAQAPDAQIGTLQLLRLGGPRMFVQVFVDPGRRAWVTVERVHGLTWRALVSLREDGTMVRTLIAPSDAPHDLLDTWEGLLGGPPLIPGFADRVRRAIGERFVTTFPDRPGVGVRQRVLPTGTRFVDAVAAHQAHLDETGAGAALTDHPIELYLPALRRLVQIQQEHHGRARRRGFQWLVLSMLGGVALTFALCGVLWKGPVPFWLAWFLVELGGAAVWSLLLRHRPGAVTSLALVAALGTLVWAPANAWVVGLLLLIGVARRVAFLPSIAGSQGGAVAARWSAGWTEPARVPAAQLGEVYAGP